MWEAFGALDHWEITGLVGASSYCASYYLVAYDIITSKSSAYYILNLVAALRVLISLYQHFNIASLIIQIFFAGVSIIGVVRHNGRSVEAET